MIDKGLRVNRLPRDDLGRGTITGRSEISEAEYAVEHLFFLFLEHSASWLAVTSIFSSSPSARRPGAHLASHDGNNRAPFRGAAG